MMQIFRVKHGATSQRRSSENETVIHRKPIPLDEVEREFMRLDVDGLHTANGADRRQHLADFRYPGRWRSLAWPASSLELTAKFRELAGLTLPASQVTALQALVTGPALLDETADLWTLLQPR